jgi:hypothetical protein
VDGVNLYHGVKSKYGRQFLWMDLYALGQQIFRAEDNVLAIRYFTTIVAGEPDAARRQETPRRVDNASSTGRGRARAVPEEEVSLLDVHAEVDLRMLAGKGVPEPTRRNSPTSRWAWRWSRTLLRDTATRPF